MPIPEERTARSHTFRGVRLGVETLMMSMAAPSTAINASAVADPCAFAVSGTRLDLAEYCCSPDSILSKRVVGDGGAATRYNLAEGFVFYKMNDVQRACTAVL